MILNNVVNTQCLSNIWYTSSAHFSNDCKRVVQSRYCFGEIVYINKHATTNCCNWGIDWAASFATESALVGIGTQSAGSAYQGEK